MKKNFKVNLEKFKDEDDLNLFLDFIERNKNKIKIIHNNQIKPLENKLITNKSKIKLILLNNPFNYKMKYKIRDIKYEGKVKNIDKNIKYFWRKICRK